MATEQFKNNQQDKITFANFIDARLKSAEQANASIMAMADMSGEGKTAAIANNNNYALQSILMFGNGFKLSKDLVNSVAGNLATTLVSPTK